ncbi:MAG TPA: CpsB/CapC family capsule biosynthesis tyrosine phosphatase [Armatimonadota bacterium]|nr:CpsB/CapC family capsule biosynthesis tyrosine phosphatase [Armatimonadota bacterium]
MIDIHCHPLPYLDDGAADWDTALEMARMACGDGITQCITTPHWTGVPGETEKAASTRAEFSERLASAGLSLRLHPGNEVVLVPKLGEALSQQRALTLGGSSYVLLETAQLEQGAYIHSALFQLQSQGYRIILAHPERVRAWQHDTADLQQLVVRGCYLQVNAGSLHGFFGKSAQKAAEGFLKQRWVSFLATDAHSTRSRPPLISEALKRCARLIGEEAAMALVTTNPARVLCDELVPAVDPDGAAPRKRSWLPWLNRG